MNSEKYSAICSYVSFNVLYNNFNDFILCCLLLLIFRKILIPFISLFPKPFFLFLIVSDNRFYLCENNILVDFFILRFYAVYFYSSEFSSSVLSTSESTLHQNLLNKLIRRNLYIFQ